MNCQRAKEIVANGSSLSHAESTDLARAYLIADAECDGLRRQLAELTALGVSLHKAAAAGRDAERAAVVAYLRGPCGDAAHDDRWCSTCDLLGALADAVERGAHREGE